MLPVNIFARRTGPGAFAGAPGKDSIYFQLEQQVFPTPFLLQNRVDRKGTLMLYLVFSARILSEGGRAGPKQAPV